MTNIGRGHSSRELVRLSWRRIIRILGVMVLKEEGIDRAGNSGWRGTVVRGTVDQV